MRGSVKHFYDFVDLNDNIIIILMHGLACVFCFHAFMLSMKVQLLLLYSHSIVTITFIATVLQQAREGKCESQSSSPDLALLLILISIPFHCIQGRARGRAAVKANAPQGVGFKCAHCNGEFGSRRS